MEARPIRLAAAVFFDAAGREAGSDGGDDRRIETAGEEDTIGDIAHQLSAHGVLQSVPDVGSRGGIGLHRIVVRPVAVVIARHAGRFAPVEMSGQEGLIAVALPFQSLQLAGDIDHAVGIVADVEGDDADGVAGNEEGIAFDIIEGKGEDAAQLLHHGSDVGGSGLGVGRHHGAIEGEDDLAVAARLEEIAVVHTPTKVLMIIDFAIDGEHLLLVGGKEGLSARLRIDDAQAFMGKDGGATAVDAAPVGTTMPDFLTHSQRLLTEFRTLHADVE